MQPPCRKVKSATATWDALSALKAYAWPGNLEELAAAVRTVAATALKEEIDAEEVASVVQVEVPALPAVPGLMLDLPLREAREAFERIYFAHHLDREEGSISRVAEKSGLERTHLYRKLKALGLTVGGRRGDERAAAKDGE